MTNKMHCDECQQDKSAHEFYSASGESVTATLIATNCNGSWRKQMCHDCWTDFQNRAFCSVTRSTNTFTATCAF